MTHPPWLYWLREMGVGASLDGCHLAGACGGHHDDAVKVRLHPLQHGLIDIAVLL